MIARILYGCFNPLFAFPYRTFWKAHSGERGKALGDINLHLNSIGLYADYGAAKHFGQHEGLTPKKFQVLVFATVFTFNIRNVTK